MAISIALRPVSQSIADMHVSEDLAEALEDLREESNEVRISNLEYLRKESKEYGLTSDSVDLLDALIDAAREYERSSGSEGRYFSIDVWY